MCITSAPPSTVQEIAATMHCKPAQFPIRYLGLPLSDKRLKRADYLTIIERIQRALAGWKAPLLSVGGRIILTNAVLSAIPQYFMSMFMLPKWTLRRIEQIRRRFLWHGHRDQQGQKSGLYMVSWALATKPRHLGGLGIRDVQITNHVLLMKWMWSWHSPTNDWWKKATQMMDDSHRPWDDPRASQFWKNISLLAPAFNCSVAHRIAQGNSVKFWHDNWLGKPLKYMFPNLYQAAVQKYSSVQQNTDGPNWSIQFTQLNPAAQIEENDLQLHLQSTHNMQGQDTVIWTRHPQGFSVKSAYHFLTNTPSPTSQLQAIWKMRAPLRVAVFGWLLLIDRLTTLDNLSKRGWQLPSMCIMCRQAEESAKHLFQLCAVAAEIRDYIYTVFATRHAIPHKYITENSIQLLTDCGVNAQARRWELTTCFVLWRERCRRTFSGKFQRHISLVREVTLEYNNWFTTNAL